jgi:hypothetical protein
LPKPRLCCVLKAAPEIDNHFPALLYRKGCPKFICRLDRSRTQISALCIISKSLSLDSKMAALSTRQGL